MNTLIVSQPAEAGANPNVIFLAKYRRRKFVVADFEPHDPAAAFAITPRRELQRAA